METATEIITTIDVCVTCMWVINGADDYEIADGSLGASMDALEALTVAGLEITDTDEDEHFSWSACALCHSYLGGSRFGATLVETVRA